MTMGETISISSNYNPGQNCWDNSRFSPSPHYNVDFSRSPKSRSVHRSLACFNIVWGEGGREKGSERRTRIADVTMEACTVNFLLLAQNLTSVLECFDPHCRRVYEWGNFHRARKAFWVLSPAGCCPERVKTQGVNLKLVKALA